MLQGIFSSAPTLAINNDQSLRLIMSGRMLDICLFTIFIRRDNTGCALNYGSYRCFYDECFTRASIYISFQVSQNSRISANVIRSDEEIATLRYVEYHFLVLVFIYVLSMIFVFLAEAFLQNKEVVYLHDIHDYFTCLKVGWSCSQTLGKILYFLYYVPLGDY